MENLVVILGAAGSLLGAGFAFWQCKLTIKAKKETISIRDKITKKYLDYELSHMRPKISHVVNQLTKHTNLRLQKSRIGLKLEDDIQLLRELLNEIRSNEIYSIDDIKVNVDSITQKLQGFDYEKNNVESLDEIIVHLTSISREFDKKIKKGN